MEYFKVERDPGTVGSWTIDKRIVTKEEQLMQSLRCMFNPQRPWRVCPAGEYTRLLNSQGVMMSDTPDEWKDHVEAINHATGHCFIGGLGLGWIVEACLRKPEVTKVTVIEKEVDVIGLVLTTLFTKYGEDRIEIIHDDIFTWQPETKYDMAWIDIWQDINMGNIVEMEQLERKIEADWFGCWNREGCLAQQYRVKNELGFY